jgi:hypothetical protein
LREHRGYHGRMTNAGVGECRACHTEHKGREADIVRLSRAQFDHPSDGLPLEGAHLALDCETCHKKGVSVAQGAGELRRLPQADDVHARAVQPKPAASATARLSWSGGKFDHDKTAFKLTGRSRPA